jgi:nitrogen-specific signal transduction histidine kinase/ActR/RegA family two-component response regulator
MRPVRNRAGDVIAIVPEAMDLTDRRIAEEQLRHAQKMEAIGQLTGGIAHDFNNLMAGVIGALALTRRRIDAGKLDDIGKFMEAADASARRAAMLTQRLLAFARRQSLAPSVCDVPALITGMTDLLHHTIGESVSLEIARSDGVWPAMADAHQFENALLNLVINARDAMPEGGRLKITVANRTLGSADVGLASEIHAGNYLEIAVSDSGTGMPPEVIQKAFDPFFTTKPIGQGTGLGLSMVYGFAKQSGGFASIDSTPGQGTTVRLYLPRAVVERQAAEVAEAAELPAGRGETILVVEDDPTVRLLAVATLNDLGYRCLDASDASTGIPILLSPSRIDLLLTDVGLPQTNGRQLAEIARQHRPGLKVLFMTGYAEKAAVRGQFLDEGMDLITKPFDLEAFSQKVREMIEASPPE